MPGNPQCTFSQGALKKYNKYQSVRTEALDWVHIIDNKNNSIKLPTLPIYKDSKLMDYISVQIVKLNDHVITPTNQLTSHCTSYHPLPSVNKGIFTKLGHNLSYEQLHRRLSHVCEKKIASMCKQQTLIGLPKTKPKRHHASCICAICTITKQKNRNKGKTVDTSSYTLGQVIHLDLTFFDTPSIRGFNSVLNIIDAKSRKLFGFPTSAKSVPTRIIKFFLLAMEKEGKTVVEIRVDEEGAIARSATFTSMIVDEFPGIRIVPTGGYASWLNGKVERPNLTLKDGTRANLMDADKAVIFWCYAYLDYIKKYNCTLHSAIGDCPDYIWYNTRPSIHQLIPWGSVIYPLAHNPKALEN